MLIRFDRIHEIEHDARTGGQTSYDVVVLLERVLFRNVKPLHNI